MISFARCSDGKRMLSPKLCARPAPRCAAPMIPSPPPVTTMKLCATILWRSEEHTSELQSHSDLVCRLLLEKKKKKRKKPTIYTIKTKEYSNTSSPLRSRCTHKQIDD